MDLDTQKKCSALLQANGLAPERLDILTLSQLFLSQMRVSLYGGEASIPVLPSFLKPFGDLPQGKKVAVAEVDDREIRTSLVSFAQGKALVEPGESFPVPGREYPAPLEDLLFAVGELVEPLLEQAQLLALCLPFPVDYDSKGDGVIRSFPGSMSVQDFAGQPVLAALGRELEGRGCPLPPMVLVNEAAAVLAAAGVEKPGQSRYLGLDWGSTIDMGFVAPGSIAVRWPAIPGHLMLFNGGFASAQCVPFGGVDLPKDRDSYAPGNDLYWKMVSTDYLGDTFRLMMIKAAEAKLLTFPCSRDLLSLTFLSFDDFMAFLAQPHGEGFLAHFCRRPEDLEVALTIGQAVIQRAARLVAANIAALLQFIGAGQEAERPVCLGLFGKTVDTPLMTAALGLVTSLSFHLTFQKGEAMGAVGAAAAALYNA